MAFCPPRETLPQPTPKEARRALVMLAHGRLKAGEFVRVGRGLAQAWVDGHPHAVLELNECPHRDFSSRDVEPKADAPRVICRVAAFSSAPWGGRVGLLARLPQDESAASMMGLWRLDEPSPAFGTKDFFLRMGDYEDAELLFARMLAWAAPEPEAELILGLMAAPEPDSMREYGFLDIFSAAKALACALSLARVAAPAGPGAGARRI